MSINILILAAGNSDINTDLKKIPPCLTEFNGTSIIEKIISNTNKIKHAKYTFAILKKDDHFYHLGQIIKLLVPDADITIVPESTKGSACSALLAACTLKQENSLLIISANELIDLDLGLIQKDFEQRNLDAGTLTFKSIQPRYSYVRLNQHNIVIEAAQKKPISKNATAGVFWFKITKEFCDSAKEMIRKNNLIDEAFYIAPIFNEMILNHKKIGVVEIDIANYHPLKNDTQIKQFELNGEN